MKFAISAVLLFAVAAQASTDSDKWKRQGELNANKDLDKFEAAVEQFTKGSKAPLVSAVKSLQAQITDADENNKQLVPKIDKLIGAISTLAKTDGKKPNFVERFALRSLVRLVANQRDNKSYYVLDGAQSWVQLRDATLAQFSANSTQVKDVQVALKSVQESTVALRDQLDGMASQFVKSLHALRSLVDDVPKNIDQIQATVADMKKATAEGPDFIKNSAALRAKVDEVVKSVSS